MTNAYLDENSVPTLIGTLNSDGTSITRVLADPSRHSIMANDGTTGSDNGNNGNNANKDQNGRSVLIATSSVDGKTPVEVYVDSTGALLISTA